MKEYGSDFHRCEFDYLDNCDSKNLLPRMILYANGRQALHVIIQQEQWKRIWIPAYFCYDVVDYLKRLGIQVLLYDDNPLCTNDDKIVRALPYREGDVLLRMNYFGLRNQRSNKDISVPVIEDHSHDLISNWALNSDADWCIASLRKSLPIAMGGALWSFKHDLPNQLPLIRDCESVSDMRYQAMFEKCQYLRENIDNKDIFRSKYISTEEQLEQLPLSEIDSISKQILNNFDIRLWTGIRGDNWIRIYDKLSNRWNILRPNSPYQWNPFSVVILCDTNEERISLRDYLVQHSIYPAILWNIPNDIVFENSKNISHRMLSLHCDGRYSMNDIDEMCDIILKYDIR